MTKKELLSPADCESEYHLKKTNFYELLKRGELKAVKVGRRTFVRRSDLESWAASLPAYYPIKKSAPRSGEPPSMDDDGGEPSKKDELQPPRTRGPPSAPRSNRS